MKNILFQKRSDDDVQKQKLSFCFILKKQDGREWIGLIWLKIGQVTAVANTVMKSQGVASPLCEVNNIRL